MVVRHRESEDRGQALSLMLHALADPTRRDIMRGVLGREESISTIASRYPMSFAAVQKHVAILERAGLVQKRRVGREHLVSGQLGVLIAIDHLLQQYESLWRQRIDQMEDVLADE